MTRIAVIASLVCLPALAADGPVKEKPRVAVLYFDVNHNDPKMAVLRKGLAQMLITDLAADPAVTLVERDRLEEVLKELDLQQTKHFDPAATAKIGKLLGAKYQIAGDITEIVGTPDVLFQARIIHSEKGVAFASAMAPIRVKALASDMFEAEQSLLAKIAAALSAADQREPPALPAKTGVKLKLENALKFSEALDAIDKKDKKGAKEKLDQVVKAQPDFLLASLELDRLMK
jgi:TolB-like protein